jgi:5,10-methenyltetrahydrofolate synthetase
MPEAMHVDSGIQDLLARFEAFVTYVPLRTEVSFKEIVVIPVSSSVYEIAPRAALDPEEEARKAFAAAGGTDTCVLLPGRKFDSAGTRLGQGGGWYDRFLEKVPLSWTRIGFCFDYQFSNEVLVRESWDQPMDYVVVVDHADGTSILHTATRGPNRRTP